MNKKVLAIVFAVLLIGALVPFANADADNRAIQFVTSGPVEVPGLVLGRGTYQLKLMGNGSSVAGIWNADGTKFYGYFDTIPAGLNHVAANTKVVLEGSGRTSPKRIEEWFYPGYSQGNEFIYPAAQTTEVARSGSTSQALNR